MLRCSFLLIVCFLFVVIVNADLHDLRNISPQQPLGYQNGEYAEKRQLQMRQLQQQVSNVDIASDAISKKYAGADTAAKIQDYIPCLVAIGGPYKCELDPQDPDIVNSAFYYGVNLALWAVPGLVIFIVTPILFFMCCLCRNFLCCCKSRKTKTFSPMEAQKYFQSVMVLVVISTVFACLGLASNETLNDGLVGAQGFHGLAQSFIEDVDIVIAALVSPAVQIRDMLDPTVASISTLLSQSNEIVGNGTVDLATAFQSLSDELASNSNIIVPAVGLAPQMSIPCDLCTTLSNNSTGIMSDVNSQSAMILDSFSQSINTIDGFLTGNVDQLNAGLTTAVDLIGNSTTVVTDFKPVVQQYLDLFLEYNAPRNTITIICYSFPLFAFVSMVLVGVLRTRILLNVNLILQSIALMLAGLTFAIAMPVGIVLGDVCKYVNIAETNFAAINPEVGRIMNTCLQDLSLIEAFNMTDQLAFRDQISFPPLFDLASQLNFTQLDALIVGAAALDQQAAFLTSSATATALSALNGACAIAGPPCPGAPFDLTTYTTLDLVTYATLQLQYDSVAQADVADQMMTAKIADLKIRTDAVTNATAIFRQKLNIVQMDLQAIQTLVYPLFAIVDNVIGVARCGFVGDLYLGVKTALCSTISSACTFLALASFVIVSLSMPIVNMSLDLKTRMKAVDELDDIEMNDSTYRQSGTFN